MNELVWVLIIMSAFKPVGGSGYMINTVGRFESKTVCEEAAKQVKGAISDKKSILATVCVGVMP